MILTLDNVEGVFREGWEAGAAFNGDFSDTASAAATATEAWEESTARTMYADAGKPDPVPPFPQEPAFGSPAAVEQAARAIRRYGLNTAGRIFMLGDEQPDSLAHFANLEDHRELLAEVERLRTESAGLAAGIQLLRGVAEQRDALADALELAEPALAIKASLRHGEQEQCQRALEAVHEALRKAGRRLP
jgi:hypothetical protein